MGSSMKSYNKLEGASNFSAWKIRIDLLLGKEGLLGIVKGKATKPEKNEVKSKFEKDNVTTMIITTDSIEHHSIPYVTSLQSSKQIYDSLSDFFDINNIGQAMSLKNELRDVRMKINGTIASYSMRISQLRDQLK